MTEQEINAAFRIAVDRANSTKLQLPSDVMLYFYAYYKQATQTEEFYKPAPEGTNDLRNAFKLNALFQVKNLTPLEAKLEYMRLVEQYITD